MAACAALCGQREVSWETSRCEGRSASTVRQLLRPEDLLVLGSAAPLAIKKDLLRRPGQEAVPAVLVCPDDGPPWSRVLVLHEEQRPVESFLATAVQLCRVFGAKPVVLTVARSERSAGLRQQAAQEALARTGLACEFDLVSGAEIRTAVIHVARWRRCQAVVLARPAAPPWWRWWQSGTPEKLLGLADTLSLLTLPERDARGAPPEPAPAVVPQPVPLSAWH